ncbi:MAG: hypothetical protein CM1200mP28_18270 [Deltaproteobacteria bacterium]|nr:MAG: hypothetical protein CM1200mP28_18270 [Deltaproteobacteria bacterium]
MPHQKLLLTKQAGKVSAFPTNFAASLSRYAIKLTSPRPHKDDNRALPRPIRSEFQRDFKKFDYFRAS